MPLEKIPAILLIGLGIHIALTETTPPTPKNERRIGEGLDINLLMRVMKASSFLHPKYTKVTNLPQGWVLDVCNHRALHHCGGNNVGVHLVKSSYRSPVTKWQTSTLH